MTNKSIFDKLIEALGAAESHNRNLLVRPEVILWPDPERQWESIIPVLQAHLPQLLVYGPYVPESRSGPAIWIKCMLAGTVDRADWGDAVPVIYMPGVAKAALRNVENAVFDLQPLIEYQYTGTLFLQENGREWTVLSLVESKTQGLGVDVGKDTASREALRKSLPIIFQDRDFWAGMHFVDAADLNATLFPDILPTLLKWMCKGDVYLKEMEPSRQEAFRNICQLQFDFVPDHRNIVTIAEKLGAQKGAWKQAWQLYATAPNKFPELEGWLRLAMPADRGAGMYQLPDESWPQLCEAAEEQLAEKLMALQRLDVGKVLAQLKALEVAHSQRRGWVWAELEKAPLAMALQHLLVMAESCQERFASATIDELRAYYTERGYRADQAMRQALATVRSSAHKTCVVGVIRLVYEPWIRILTEKFQNLLTLDSRIFTVQASRNESEDFVLFVDAFRYELAQEFLELLSKDGYKATLQADWSAIPSVTPTAKPAVAPIGPLVSANSAIEEFCPHLANGRKVQTATFRDALPEVGFAFAAKDQDIRSSGRFWREIGTIDSTGHQEGADMVRRIPELFEEIQESIDAAFAKGYRRIKVVTDHGWLLLPGGLPKTELKAGLVQTRWGRCALIKEAAKVDLLHLPWRWNPAVYIAYAPGISFFKANEEYAHGGISLHECLVPVLLVEKQEDVSKAEIKMEKWVNLKCTVQTIDTPDGYRIDIRTKFNDPNTSVVDIGSRNKAIQSNQVTLMLEDDYLDQAATIVLLDANGRIIDKKPTTVGGNK